MQMSEDRLWYIGSKDGPLLPAMSHAPQQCDFAAPSITVKLISPPLESQLASQLALAHSRVTKGAWCDF